MPVADWTIQCDARSGPLTAGGAPALAPGRETPAQCFLAPAWRCRSIPVLFAWVTPAGVASVASSEFDLNPRGSWPDDASNVAFAVTGSADVVAGWGNSV